MTTETSGSNTRTKTRKHKKRTSEYSRHHDEQHHHATAVDESATTAAPVSTSAWESFTSPDGRTYYYNKVTQESRWKLPKELRSKASTSASSSAPTASSNGSSKSRKASRDRPSSRSSVASAVKQQQPRDGTGDAHEASTSSASTRDTGATKPKAKNEAFERLQASLAGRINPMATLAHSGPPPMIQIPRDSIAAPSSSSSSALGLRMLDSGAEPDAPGSQQQQDDDDAFAAETAHMSAAERLRFLRKQRQQRMFAKDAIEQADDFMQEFARNMEKKAATQQQPTSGASATGTKAPGATSSTGGVTSFDWRKKREDEQAVREREREQERLARMKALVAEEEAERKRQKEEEKEKEAAEQKRQEEAQERKRQEEKEAAEAERKRQKEAEEAERKRQEEEAERVRVQAEQTAAAAADEEKATQETAALLNNEEEQLQVLTTTDSEDTGESLVMSDVTHAEEAVVNEQHIDSVAHSHKQDEGAVVEDAENETMKQTGGEVLVASENAATQLAHTNDDDEEAARRQRKEEKRARQRAARLEAEAAALASSEQQEPATAPTDAASTTKTKSRRKHAHEQQSPAATDTAAAAAAMLSPPVSAGDSGMCTCCRPHPFVPMHVPPPPHSYPLYYPYAQAPPPPLPMMMMTYAQPPPPMLYAPPPPSQLAMMTPAALVPFAQDQLAMYGYGGSPAMYGTPAIALDRCDGCQGRGVGLVEKNGFCRHCNRLRLDFIVASTKLRQRCAVCGGWGLGLVDPATGTCDHCSRARRQSLAGAVATPLAASMARQLSIGSTGANGSASTSTKRVTIADAHQRQLERQESIEWDQSSDDGSEWDD